MFFNSGLLPMLLFIVILWGSYLGQASLVNIALDLNETSGYHEGEINKYNENLLLLFM